MKRIASLVLALSLVFGSTVAFADTCGNALNEANQVQGYIDIHGDEAIVSEVMTFDEMVKQISQESNQPIDEVVNQMQRNQEPSGFMSMSKSSDTLSAMATYRSITVQFNVNPFYNPSLRFYCQTSEGGGFWGIQKILNVDMNRTSGYATSKAFGGTVYTNLENAGTIFWIVNGDFYDQGTTTVNTGVDIGVKEFATVNFSASYSSNHYAYCNQSGRYNVR